MGSKHGPCEGVRHYPGRRCSVAGYSAPCTHSRSSATTTASVTLSDPYSSPTATPSLYRWRSPTTTSHVRVINARIRVKKYSEKSCNRLDNLALVLYRMVIHGSDVQRSTPHTTTHQGARAHTLEELSYSPLSRSVRRTVKGTPHVLIVSAPCES